MVGDHMGILCAVVFYFFFFTILMSDARCWIVDLFNHCLDLPGAFFFFLGPWAKNCMSIRQYFDILLLPSPACIECQEVTRLYHLSVSSCSCYAKEPHGPS